MPFHRMKNRTPAHQFSSGECLRSKPVRCHPDLIAVVLTTAPLFNVWRMKSAFPWPLNVTESLTAKTTLTSYSVTKSKCLVRNIVASYLVCSGATLTSSNVLTVTALTWPGTAMATTTAWMRRTAMRRTAPLPPPSSAPQTSSNAPTTFAFSDPGPAMGSQTAWWRTRLVLLRTRAPHFARVRRRLPPRVQSSSAAMASARSTCKYFV